MYVCIEMKKRENMEESVLCFTEFSEEGREQKQAGDTRE